MRSCTNPTPAHGGANCTGEPTEHVSCTNIPCPIDGGWTEWSHVDCTYIPCPPYGTCSVSCGEGGTRMKRRTCTNPTPAYGGADCTGEDSEQVDCAIIECPYVCQHTWIPGVGCYYHKLKYRHLIYYALDQCAALNGRLVSFETKREAEHVCHRFDCQSQVQRGRWIWTNGANGNPNNPQGFMWWDSGIPVNHSWLPGFPLAADNYHVTLEYHQGVLGFRNDNGYTATWRWRPDYYICEFGPRFLWSMIQHRMCDSISENSSYLWRRVSDTRFLLKPSLFCASPYLINVSIYI